MSQQGSSRYWLVVGLFLVLNSAGLVWIRQAWNPQRDATRMMTLDVTARDSAKSTLRANDDPATADKPSTADASSDTKPGPLVDSKAAVTGPHVAPRGHRPTRILAWLPVSSAASALVPENVAPNVSVASGASFDTAERLLAVFDRPVVTERDLNRPLEQAPFHCTPMVMGHWRWTSPARLAFVLDNPLPPGRKFELSAAVDFDDATRTQLAAPSRTFKFTTRPLEWQGVTLQACDRESVTFELTFNQPVAPADLLRAIVVSDAAHPAANGAIELDPFSDPALETQVKSVERALGLQADVLTKETAVKLVVRARRRSFGKGSESLRITLASALTGPGTDLPLGSTQSRVINLPTAFAFVRSQVYSASFKDEVAVQLYFSRGLSPDQERPKIRVTPAVEDLHLEFNPSHGAEAGEYSRGAGVVLHGKFLCGQRYSLTLPSTILAHEGQTLGETSAQLVQIPHRPADLKIAAGQGILIPDGNLTLDLQCVNINGVRMSASRLHANNLAAFLQGRNDSATMRSLVHERVRSLDLPKDEPRTVALDLRQLLQANKDQPDEGQPIPRAADEPLTGLYRVKVADTNEYWNCDLATVAITDLGITAKRGRTGWLVWVLSLRSAEPLSGATITARSFNNQVLAQATTDAAGIATLSIPDNHPDGQAWLLTAERNGDLNYLLPDRHGWMVDTVDQSGRAWPDHYEAMLYTERGVYRPGDTVHLTGILRDRLGHRPPSFPLTVKVTRPDGRVVAELPCSPAADSQGMFHVDYPSSETGQTGVYRFDVAIPGTRQSLGSASAQIEAFVPVRIAVTAAPVKPRFVKETPAIQTEARYLFGQAAAGLNVAATGTWQRISFPSKEHPGYQFGDLSGRNQQQIVEVQRTLDDVGKCELPIAGPVDDRPGLWSANVTTTVTEIGGRSVSTMTRLETDMAGIHLGIKPPENRVVVVGEATKFDWIALDAQEQLAGPRSMQLTLVRVDYDTAIEQVNGRPVWKTTERLIDAESRSIEGDATSSGKLDLTCPTPGRYRLRLVDVATKAATQIEFHAATNRSDRVDVPLQQPEQLDIVLDRAKYSPGDVARVLVRAPFAGRLLLTLEGDRVYDRQVLSLDANSQLIELPVPADLRGGAYVTATVIRAIDPQRGDWLPHRAYGLARLVLDRTPNTLPVRLEASHAALPGSLLKVRAQVDWTASPAVANEAANQAPNGARPEIERLPQPSRPMVHLWAVDEGILMTTRFSTPRPLDFFHAPRKLGVSSADIYSSLLPDHMRPASVTQIGADAGEDAKGDVDAARRSPVSIPRTAPAVVWRTVQPVSDDGSLMLDLPLPQFTGTMRLMAVAVHGDRYGSVDHRVTVTSPLHVESTWPRCAAPSDQFRVPVKIFNTTSTPLDIHLRSEVSGPVTLKMIGVAAAKPETMIRIEPNKSFIQWLNVTGDGIGPATIRIEASSTAPDGSSLTAFTEGHLAIRTAAPLDSETTIERQRVGEPFTLQPVAGFLEGTTRVSIAISGLPSADLNPALDSLIDYPYGCGEQTSSRLYALLAARSWLESDQAPNVDSARRQFIAQLIDAGVVRLWSMQNRNGGIGYWHGGPSDPWITAYAAGAIVAARDAGRTINPQMIADLGKYLESVLDGHAGDEVDDNIRAFLCRILASLDKPKQGWMSRLSDRIESLDAEGRAHLAAAWIRLGRKDRAASVLPEETFRLTAVTSSAGRITSPIRQDASLLQVLLELNPQHAMVPALVDRIQATRQNQRWMNTLENASAITALARYRALAPATNEFTGTVQWGADQTAFTHASPLHERRPGDDQPLTITTQGKGEFYVVRTIEGLRAQKQVVAHDRQLKVRRRWLDRSGRDVDPSQLRVGDLIHVEVAISAVDGGNSVPNVAIVDALPGGVEIENPRLATSAMSATPATAGEAGARRADHVEFLDDRAVLFTTVQRQPQLFRYAVRVTTPGLFEWPPIQASSMYDPAFASIHGGGRVVVRARDEVIDNVAERPDDNAAHRH